MYSLIAIQKDEVKASSALEIALFDSESNTKDHINKLKLAFGNKISIFVFENSISIEKLIAEAQLSLSSIALDACNNTDNNNFSVN